MTSEEYGQYIDDFELGADVMPGEDLTKYIERRRREFENKADGGVIGIEVLFADKEPRTKMVSGGFLKSIGAGLGSLFKAGKDKIADFAETQASKKIYDVENFKPTVYPKSGPMTIEALEAVDGDIVKRLLRTQELGLNKETPEILKAANLLRRFTKEVGGKRVIDYDRAEDILGVKLKGNETIDELLKIEFQTRPENKLADGGRVGLFMGGDPLTGQALEIYNSMNTYGFSDQEIADALSARGLYTAAGSGTGTETTESNIIGAQLNQGGGGGGGITELQKTFTKDLSENPRFNYLEPTAQANKYRFDRSVEPRDGVMGFFDKIGNKFKESKFSQPKIRGTLGTRLAGQKPIIPLPSFAAAYSRSPFNIKSPNYNPLLESQLNFAELGDNIVGMSNTGLKYGSGSVLAGKNVISGFGTNDYEKMLQDYISKMNAYQTKKATDARAVKIAKAEEELKALQAATEKARAAQYGPTDYGRGSDGQRSYDFGQGFGIGATTGGPVSNRTGRGRTDYSKGGVATMFTRRR